MNYTDITPRTVDAGWVLCDCGKVQPSNWDRAYCSRCYFTLPGMCDCGNCDFHADRWGM